MTDPDNSVLKVRRSVYIAEPPDRVWTEFADLERMRTWWGVIKSTPLAGTSQGQWLDVYEPRVGGRIEMAVTVDGARTSYGGLIRIFDACRDLTFENDWIPNRGHAAPTYVTIRLTPAPEGTLVELFHHGIERVGGDVAAQHEAYEQGWGMTQLSELKAIVETAAV